MAVVFEQRDPTRPPASELIEAVLAEFDATMGRRLRGGPSATPDELSPPGGAYLVGFVADEPVCGGGIKDLGDGIAELKRMYVVRGSVVAAWPPSCWRPSKTSPPSSATA